MTLPLTGYGVQGYRCARQRSAGFTAAVIPEAREEEDSYASILLYVLLPLLYLDAVQDRFEEGFKKDFEKEF
ncbi:hypothetical protein BHYA_0061g00080 [Botrytis hyacinthi]|uniref:Uncharacterized protein n=1 Tax=Botrytis hyacinthi TaxID=278943 RepID=A0A4Z1H0S2_9HELO|nr:hypothetical protein BHYA_0061g00080 [Botrytis hyacinthi]